MPNLIDLLQEMYSRYSGVHRPAPGPGPALNLQDRSAGIPRPGDGHYPRPRPGADAVYARAAIDAITSANKKAVPRRSRDPHELAQIIRILMNMRGQYRGGAPTDLKMMRRYGGGPGGMSGGMGRPPGR